MIIIATISILLVLSVACSNTTELPTTFSKTEERIVIYPDYDSVVLPPNIAPTNFNITSKPNDAVVLVKGEKGGSFIVRSDKDCSIRFDIDEWRNLLSTNKGANISFTIYTYDGKSWYEHPAITNHIAEEEIDPYLSYRLIEPSYIAYFDLGIYQRNLTNFVQTPIYRNEGNHCINCHSYQNRKTDKMMFHVRENHGGTIVVNNDRVEKINTKADSMYAACVYPSWHPTQNKIAFSTNQTGQYFYLINSEKAEVMDSRSYLVLYDLDKHEISTIVNEPYCLETFPSWNPSGDRLYYSTCRNIRNLEEYRTGNRDKAIGCAFDSLYYDIWSIPYDTISGTFGTAQIEFEASQHKQSATLPRISPDGKWLMFTLGSHGQFHIWHKSSDLYLKNLITGEIHALKNANSNDVDSYHSWSSNGRWVALSTRREDFCYTRPYFCYFDKDGNDYKPFALPQENPLQSKLLLKSYNVPEFMIEPVKINEDKFKDVIFNTEPILSTYSK